MFNKENRNKLYYINIGCVDTFVLLSWVYYIASHIERKKKQN